MANDIELSRATIEITGLIDSYSDRLDKDQLEALPLVSYGMPITHVAKQIGIPEAKVRKWVNGDVVFRQAVSDFRQVKDDYHESMLNQASVLAWAKIFEILGDPLLDEKVAADMAKFIVTQLSLKTEKREVKHKIEPQLNVTEDSAGLIAKKLKDLQDGTDIVDAEYKITVEDEEVDSSAGMTTAKAVDEFYGDDFDAEFREIEGEESSKYIMHPDCTYGQVEFNEKSLKFRCHMCGTWTKDLVVHIRTEHKLSPGRYRNMYGLGDDVMFFVDVPNEATDEDIAEFNEELEQG